MLDPITICELRARLERASRSVTPAPATLSLADARNLNAVRERLRLALRTADTLPALRSAVAELASDLESALAPAPDEHEADTVRDLVRPWEGDCAPATPRDSALGEEYGC